MATEEGQINITKDLRRLLIIDSNNLLQNSSEGILTEKIMINEGIKNYKLLISDLFTLLSSQQGKEQEDIDYEKSPDEVILPEAIIKLPRALPIPKEKPLTKWEKYMKEKGIEKRKRSRLVYSETAQDWVPRWGKGSAKKIEDENNNWIMEEKQAGVNPFEEKKNKKLLAKAKQDRRQLKNEMRRGQANAEKQDSTNKNENNEGKSKKKMSKKEFKKMKEEKAQEKLKEDKKNLDKRLEFVQKNTRSMGKFDKKLKNEKEVNFLKKKRVNKDIIDDRNKEKQRNKRILDFVLKDQK